MSLDADDTEVYFGISSHSNHTIDSNEVGTLDEWYTASGKNMCIKVNWLVQLTRRLSPPKRLIMSLVLIFPEDMLDWVHHRIQSTECTGFAVMDVLGGQKLGTARSTKWEKEGIESHRDML